MMRSIINLCFSAPCFRYMCETACLSLHGVCFSLHTCIQSVLEVVVDSIMACVPTNAPRAIVHRTGHSTSCKSVEERTIEHCVPIPYWPYQPVRVPERLYTHSCSFPFFYPPLSFQLLPSVSVGDIFSSDHQHFDLPVAQLLPHQFHPACNTCILTHILHVPRSSHFEPTTFSPLTSFGFFEEHVSLFHLWTQAGQSFLGIVGHDGRLRRAVQLR